MCTMWHVDKYKITFKLVINSRRISRGPVQLMATGYGQDGPVIDSRWGEIFRTCPGQP